MEGYSLHGMYGYLIKDAEDQREIGHISSFVEIEKIKEEFNPTQTVYNHGLGSVTYKSRLYTKLMFHQTFITDDEIIDVYYNLAGLETRFTPSGQEQELFLPETNFIGLFNKHEIPLPTVRCMAPAFFPRRVMDDERVYMQINNYNRNQTCKTFYYFKSRYTENYRTFTLINRRRGLLPQLCEGMILDYLKL